MPLYDFKCRACKHEFEAHVKLEELENDPDCIECPNCEIGKTERMITNPRHYKHLSWSTWNV